MPKNYGLADDIELSEVPAPDLPYRPRNPKSHSPSIALVGCGGISHRHLATYKDAGYLVVALCDCDAARAESRRAEFYPDAKVYTDPASTGRMPVSRERLTVTRASRPGVRRVGQSIDLARPPAY